MNTEHGSLPLWGDCPVCGSRRELELFDGVPVHTPHQRLTPLNTVCACEGSCMQSVPGTVSSHAQNKIG